MNRMTSRSVVAALLSALALVACTGEVKDAPVSSAPENKESKIDALMADVETGRDPGKRAELEALLADTSLPKSEHAKIALSLSRLLEATDRERAIQLTEDAVAAESDEAEERLFTLLTGSKPPSRWARRGPTEPVPNAAMALAKYFPTATPEHKVEVRIKTFGGEGGRHDREGGAFDIAGALRTKAEEACGLCDEVKVSIGTHSSSWPSWTNIPREVTSLEQALVVSYFDVQNPPVARYEKWFAAPVADITSAIASGEGLVAVKERPGAPPLVTVAAPRAALLPLVEAKLAVMSELPLSPKRVPIDTHLSKDEVRAGFRTRLSAFKKCYEDLRARRSDAAGTIESAYGIKADGSVVDVTTSVSGSLDDAAFRECVADGVRSIRYPRWSWSSKNDVTTVRYPLTLEH